MGKGERKNGVEYIKELRKRASLFTRTFCQETFENAWESVFSSVWPWADLACLLPFFFKHVFTFLHQIHMRTSTGEYRRLMKYF